MRATPRDAKNAGGITLYGRSFGNYNHNYNQDIKVRINYREVQKHMEEIPA